MTVSALASPGSASVLWYLSRGTGVVALVLLTMVMALGVLTRGGRPLPNLPRFVTAGLHRNASLLAVCFLVVHIVTAIADPYAPIKLTDAVLPFASAYRPVWLGLGAVAFALLAAVVVTSMLRLGLRQFRAVHRAAYALWPLALVHGLGTGTDVRTPWMLLLVAGCVFVVVTAVLWRVGRLPMPTPTHRRAYSALAVAMPVVIAAWMLGGPLASHWAARAGTPSAAAASTPASGSGTPGSGAVHGTFAEQVSGGTATIRFDGVETGAHAGRVAVVLTGTPSGNGGVTLTSGTISLTPTGGAAYSGAVTQLAGDTVTGQLATSSRDLPVTVVVRPDAQSRTFDGSVTVQ
jgi:methionine sulfoxide reductase heme-binding subunit